MPGRHPSSLRSASPSAAALAAVILCLGACQATNTVQSNNPAVRPNAVDVSYKVNNPSLASTLKVKSAYQDVKNGTTFVQVNVRNEGAGELRYMWQVEWFDAKGMRLPIEPVTWNRAFLQERQDGEITFSSPSPAAMDWRLTLDRWERK
ncbi:MAG: DUF1425 domain-containing protein [Phycisphaerales bacterium]